MHQVFNVAEHEQELVRAQGANKLVGTSALPASGRRSRRNTVTAVSSALVVSVSDTKQTPSV